MAHRHVEKITDTIKKILLAERTLLVDGRAADALALSEEKGVAIQELERSLKSQQAIGIESTFRDHIKDIVRIAQENEQHFLAVCNGLKSLIGRLEGADTAVRAGVYDQCGNEICFTGAVGGYLKKA